jgi:peptide-methionine (S)-S-oxide reductase
MKIEKATFGAGCFWCSEAIYSSLKGVIKVIPGYSGGHVVNPNYEQVYTDTTGHAEVVRIEFDSDIVPYSTLLEIFWKTHDPTTPDQQGEDIGTRYRSVIFYNSQNQKKTAEAILNKLENEKIWNSPVVTTIEPLVNFYEAENYHQNYYRNNSQKEYCSLVITPKIDKFKKIFKDYLKF